VIVFEPLTILDHYERNKEKMNAAGKKNAAHYGNRIVDPVVFRASRSRWERAASASG
jgi:hypothetical protein